MAGEVNYKMKDYEQALQVSACILIFVCTFFQSLIPNFKLDSRSSKVLYCEFDIVCMYTSEQNNEVSPITHMYIRKCKC